MQAQAITAEINQLITHIERRLPELRARAGNWSTVDQETSPACHAIELATLEHLRAFVHMLDTRLGPQNGEKHRGSTSETNLSR